jgi:hypothetical protein
MATDCSVRSGQIQYHLSRLFPPSERSPALSRLFPPSERSPALLLSCPAGELVSRGVGKRTEIGHLQAVSPL